MFSVLRQNYYSMKRNVGLLYQQLNWWRKEFYSNISLGCDIKLTNKFSLPKSLNIYENVIFKSKILINSTWYLSNSDFHNKIIFQEHPGILNYLLRGTKCFLVGSRCFSIEIIIIGTLQLLGMTHQFLCSIRNVY